MRTGILTYCVVFLSLVSLTGCDFMRFVAGRPSSEELAAKSVRIAEHEEGLRKEQARLDSIALVKKAEEARTAAKDSIALLGMPLQYPGQFRSLNGVRIDHAYGMIVGTYKNEANALKLADSIRSMGYPVDILRYPSGAIGISVCATDDPIEFVNLCNKAKMEAFCRPDAWILVNERKDAESI